MEEAADAKKDLTCGGRLRRALAFDRWSNFISGLTLSLVNLRWVVVFLLTEIFLGAFFAAFYYKYSQVAEFGWPSKEAQSYMMLGGFRVVSSLFGLFAVSTRNIYLARIFFFPLIFNFFAGLASMRPIFVVDCQCTSWEQCFALEAFVTPPEHVLNPFSFPTEARFNGQRKVPMETPLSTHGHAQRHGPPGSLLQHQHNRSAPSHPEAPPHASFVELAVNVNADGVAALEPSRNRRISRHDVVEREDPEIGGEQKLWTFFNTVGEGISFSSQHDDCTPQDVDQDRMEKLTNITKKLRAGEDVEEKATEMPWITSQLWLCFQNPLCTYVHLNLTEGGTQAFACRVKGTQTPLVEGNAGTTAHTWFEKKVEEVQAVRANPEESAKVTSETFRHLPVEEAMNDVQEAHADACACDDATSCRIYKGIHGRDNYWCWVAKEKKMACEARNIELNWDEERDAFWAEDLCRKADCKCSGIGQAPSSHDGDMHTFSEGLWDNQMNYGSSCQKWHQDDGWAWCFVGFDSICPDRHPEERRVGSADMTWQWRSALPCNEELQVQHVSNAAARCENVSVTAQIVALVFFFGFLPMYQALFQFITRRCCDHTFTEEQFHVDWSDSDADSDSDASEKAGGDGNAAEES